MTTGYVLGKGRPVNPQFADLTQAERAKRNGISQRQQEKLDAIARKSKSLLKKVQAGKLSVHAAYKEVGNINDPTPFETVERLWPKLTPEQKDKIRRLP